MTQSFPIGHRLGIVLIVATLILGSSSYRAFGADDEELPDVSDSIAKQAEKGGASAKEIDPDSLADLEKVISDDSEEKPATKAVSKAAPDEEDDGIGDLDDPRDASDEQEVNKQLEKIRQAKETSPPQQRDVTQLDNELEAAREKLSQTPVPPPSRVEDELSLEEELERVAEPSPSPATRPAPPKSASRKAKVAKNEIKNLEFKMEGLISRIVVTFSKKATFREESNVGLKQFVYYFENTETPQRLQRAYDTTEFSSPVSLFTLLQMPGTEQPLSKLIVQLREDKKAKVVPTSTGLLIEFTAPDKKREPKVVIGEQENEAVEENIYSSTKTFGGKRIDRLEIKNSDVQDVLRLIAKTSGYNIVIGEDVNGRVGTLSLNNIPWDQAFALVLQSKKLGYIRQGNVLRVGTLTSLTQEKNEALQNEQSRIRVEPLRTVLIPVSYAKANDLSGRAKRFLSDRGSIDVDIRTNTMILRDVDRIVQRLQKLIAALDTQPPTVSITARIVEMTIDFFRAFGMGSTAFSSINLGGISVQPQFTASGDGGTLVTTIRAPSIANLESIFHLGETENKVKVLANPSVSVIANQPASITQGVTTFVSTTEVVNGIPTISTRGVPANLTLNVTPIVAGDGSISLTVNLTNDIPRSQSGTFSVDNRNVSTQVLIENGDTVVMGGVFKDSVTNNRSGVPLISKIPLFGLLFSRTGFTETRSEVFLFITAKITNAEESFKRNL